MGQTYTFNQKYLLMIYIFITNIWIYLLYGAVRFLLTHILHEFSFRYSRYGHNSYLGSISPLHKVWFFFCLNFLFYISPTSCPFQENVSSLLTGKLPAPIPVVFVPLPSKKYVTISPFPLTGINPLHVRENPFGLNICSISCVTWKNAR